MSVAMKLNQVFSSVKPKVETKEPKPVIAKTEEPKIEAKTDSKPVDDSNSLTNTTTKHKSGKFFEDVEVKLKSEGAALVKKVNAIIEFKISCDNNQTISYIMDLKNAPGRVFVNDGSKN